MNEQTFDHLEKDCPRCNGTGYFPKFRHIDNGKCFRCKGSGFASYAKWLPIEAIQTIELKEGSENYQADVLFTNGQSRCIPIVGGPSAGEDLTPDTALGELYLMCHKEHGLFFMPKNLPLIEEDGDDEDDYYYNSYEPEERWTDEDICNAAFDGHWDIYAHHCGY